MKVRWCVPQPVLDVANEVDWPRVAPERVPLYVAQLKSLITNRTRLQFLQDAPPVPSSVPRPVVRTDVPQLVLDVFNAVDFTRTTRAEAEELAQQLRGVVFLPLIGLPRRKAQARG